MLTRDKSNLSSWLNTLSNATGWLNPFQLVRSGSSKALAITLAFMELLQPADASGCAYFVEGASRQFITITTSTNISYHYTCVDQFQQELNIALIESCNVTVEHIIKGVIEPFKLLA